MAKKDPMARLPIYDPERETQIKALWEAGDLAGAQKIILDILQKSDDDAEISYNTYTGKKSEFQREMDDMRRTIRMALANGISLWNVSVYAIDQVWASFASVLVVVCRRTFGRKS